MLAQARLRRILRLWYKKVCEQTICPSTVAGIRCMACWECIIMATAAPPPPRPLAPPLSCRSRSQSSYIVLCSLFVPSFQWRLRPSEHWGHEEDTEIEDGGNVWVWSVAFLFKDTVLETHCWNRALTSNTPWAICQRLNRFVGWKGTYFVLFRVTLLSHAASGIMAVGTKFKLFSRTTWKWALNF